MNLWFVAIWGGLVLWALAACLPAAIKHCRTFITNGSLRIAGALGTRQVSCQSVREIQIAKVPTSRNMRATNQWMVRVFPCKHPILIYDEICGFEQLLEELDHTADLHRIPLFTPAGMRRWEKRSVSSLSAQLHI
jgi:hypothetical protein